MKNFKIWCETEKEKEAVLQKLEKQGCEWNSGHKATDYGKKFSAPVGLAVTGKYIGKFINREDFDKAISHSEISVPKFIGKNECIVIYRKDMEVIALDKSTGKTGVAKCNPADKFDFMVGAKLAFDRLTGVTTCEVARHAKVGEYVKITSESGHGRKVGEILKVVALCCNEGWVKVENAVDGRNTIRSDQYVVVEGYVPPEQEEKQEEKPLYNGKVVCVDNRANERAYTVGKIYQFKDGTITADSGISMPNKKVKIHSFEDWQSWTSAKFIEVVE